jgi:hypothetical protein
MGMNAPYIQVRYRGISLRYPFAWAPGDLVANLRHDGSISSDTAVVRGCSSPALAGLEQRCPQVRTPSAAAFDEGYARSHRAFTAALREEHRFLEAGKRATHDAITYGPGTAWLGTAALRTWIGQRPVRHAGACP